MAQEGIGALLRWAEGQDEIRQIDKRIDEIDNALGGNAGKTGGFMLSIRMEWTEAKGHLQEEREKLFNRRGREIVWLIANRELKRHDEVFADLFIFASQTIEKKWGKENHQSWRVEGLIGLSDDESH